MVIAAIASQQIAPSGFRDALGMHTWTHIKIEFAPDAAGDDTGAPAASASDAAATPETAEAEATTAAAPDDADEALGATLDAEAEVAEESSSGPLAERLPDAAAALCPERYREHLDRLITASTPPTLRRLLEPVQSAIEFASREGSVADSVRLFLAMLVCESCATDDEMRRQFVVTLKRLTKPTLLRAYAMLYGDDASCAAEVEQALARFGEDGAEAVIDRIGAAPTAALRTQYLALLKRLPAAGQALVAMLDDERPLVVERGIAVLGEVGHPDLERLLGELLGHHSVRVRQAAARGLSATTSSTFAADALLRAVQDSSAEVRLAAAVAMQSRREARLAPPLAARVEDEPELDVQLALVTALGRLAAADGVQKLIGIAMPGERVLRRRNPAALRLGAIEALGDARTPAAMSALQKLLEDRDKDVREAAARLYSRARRQTTSMSVPTVTDG